MIPREGVESKSLVRKLAEYEKMLVIPREGVESSPERLLGRWIRHSAVIPREGVESFAKREAETLAIISPCDPERGS